MSSLELEYYVNGKDFTRAGEASGEVKRVLKELGLNPDIIRNVSIALYEGEINMFLHAGGGHIRVEVTPEEVEMTLTDHGPGIADVDLAMQEGYSTASDSIRALGFGAGMGLPNMKKYTDEMTIDTTPGIGTVIRLKVRVQ
jgi:anti-sigma regulatory factor (Ser/Thr protein kinase)